MGKGKTVEKVPVSVKKEELIHKSSRGKEAMVHLRGVSPEVPEDSERKEVSRKHLEKMGCGEILDKAWIFKSPDLVSELFGKKVPTQYGKTMRGKPELWSAEL